jgi:hypothetical protein
MKHLHEKIMKNDEVLSEVSGKMKLNDQIGLGKETFKMLKIQAWLYFMMYPGESND